MSSVETMARDWVGELERRECERSGRNLPDARRELARKLSMAPGTLENIRRGRMKGLRVWVFEALRNAYLRELDRQEAALRHEREITVAMGISPIAARLVRAADAVAGEED